MKEMSREQAMAWAIALKRDKAVGDGVSHIGSINGFEEGSDNHQSIDDIYEDFNFYMIARLLNEPIWEVDFSLWTMDSLLFGEERSSIPSEDLARLIKEYGAPYTSDELESMIEEYPIGAADNFI